MARLYGLDGGEAAPATVELPLGAPGLTAYDVEYLQSLTETMGGASLLVTPDLLPDGWQEQD